MTLATIPSVRDTIRRSLQVVDSLNVWQLQEMAPGLWPKWNKYMPHSPTPKQWAFLLLPQKEALYGGSAGGGKSDGLLMGALQYVDEPGYAALLLRRTYADLNKPDALIPRSHQWLRGTDAHWRGDLNQWTFPSGAILDFGYLNNDKDIYDYQSSAYQYIGFDELTQFLEAWYTYLFSRARRLITMQHIPVRVRGATNPGGIGHDWVKRRFLIEGLAHGRAFVPARLEHNPHLDREAYEEALKELDPVTQAQLRNGDWDIRPAGELFDPTWFHIIDEDEAPPSLRWTRSWDLAASKKPEAAWTAGAKMAVHDGCIYIADIQRRREDPGGVERLVRSTAEMDGRKVKVLIEQEGGSGGVNTIFRYQRTVLFGFAVEPFHPRMDKVSRAKPVSAVAKYGGVYLLASKSRSNDWITPFRNEAAAFPTGFKDQIDSVSQGFAYLTMNPEPRARGL